MTDVTKTETENSTNQPELLQNQSRLTPKMVRALPHLASADTDAEGCRAAGISRATLTVWKKNTAFLSALKSAKIELSNECFAAFKQNAVKAAKTITALLDAPNQWLRLQAAQTVLNYLGRIREVELVEQRLEKIERLVFVERRTYSR
jgi:hypothetical protein